MEMPYHERAAFHYTVGTVFKEIIHPGYKLNKPRDMEPERKRKRQEARARQRVHRKDLDRVPMVRRYATGSMRASAVIRSASLRTFAANVLQRATTR